MRNDRKDESKHSYLRRAPVAVRKPLNDKQCVHTDAMQLKVLCRKFATLVEKVKEETKARESAEREVKQLRRQIKETKTPVITSCRTEVQAYVSKLKQELAETKQKLRECDSNETMEELKSQISILSRRENKDVTMEENEALWQRVETLEQVNKVLEDRCAVLGQRVELESNMMEEFKRQKKKIKALQEQAAVDQETIRQLEQRETNPSESSTSEYAKLLRLKEQNNQLQQLLAKETSETDRVRENLIDIASAYDELVKG